MPNVFGLDAPLVAILWLSALTHSHGIRLPPPYYFALGLVVWGIYLLDRVIDGLRLRRRIRAGMKFEELSTLPARHRYSASHPKLFIAVLLPVALLLSYLILFKLPFQSFVVPALGVSSLVWLYIGISATSIGNKTSGLFIVFTLFTGLLGAVQFRLFPRIFCGILLVIACFCLLRKVGWGKSTGGFKELMCGSIFATGVALPVLLQSTERIDEVFTHPEWLTLCAVFSLNCIGIFLSERQIGNSRPDNALAQFFMPACLLLSLIAFGISFFLVNDAAQSRFYLSAAISALLLLAVYKRFGEPAPEIHRALADAALIVPPLCLLLFRGI